MPLKNTPTISLSTEALIFTLVARKNPHIEALFEWDKRRGAKSHAKLIEKGKREAGATGRTHDGRKFRNAFPECALTPLAPFSPLPTGSSAAVR
jgi:hypothetical protein